MRSCAALVFLLLTGLQSPAQVVGKRQLTLMGSVFEITLVASDSSAAQQNIDQVVAEIERIENLISEWRPATQISEVNRNAGIRPVKVDPEVFDLTARAIHYSELSGGAFDITVAGLDRIWVFDGSMDEMPSPESVAKSVEHVGYEYIRLNAVDTTIYLEKEGMKIGFGSIGKGYAADRGREIMLEKGIAGGIVNASGDISAWGTQPDGQPWVMGIRNPFKSHKVVKKLKMETASVTTSGSYEKYAEIGGHRFSHIINPQSGYPASGLVSATVYGASAEFANALSTSLMVLGWKEGIKWMKQFPEYGYVLISDDGKTKQRGGFFTR